MNGRLTFADGESLTVSFIEMSPTMISFRLPLDYRGRTEAVILLSVDWYDRDTDTVRTVELPADSGMELSFSGVSGMLKTDLGREKGSFMNLGKGTNGEFGGANKHKVTANLTSGTVTVSQK